MPKEVVVYITPVCPYCVRTRMLLDRKGIRYREVDVSRDLGLRQRLREVTGRRTVPQIFIDGRPIGGYDQLCVLERTGMLSRMLGDGADDAAANQMAS